MNSGSVSLTLSTQAAPPARPVAARTRMILEAPVLPTVLRLAAPNVLNLLALAGMITFDGLFIGRLGADALAGVSLAFPWVMLVQHTAAGGMGGAVSSAVARALLCARDVPLPKPTTLRRPMCSLLMKPWRTASGRMKMPWANISPSAGWPRRKSSA